MTKTKRIVGVFAALAFVVASVATFAAPQQASAAMKLSANWCAAPGKRPQLSKRPGENTGECVKPLQTFLKGVGGSPGLAVDGNIGPATDTAIKRFQTNVPQLSPDGIVGTRTWEAIFWICNANPTANTAYFCNYAPGSA
ncbi:MAG TPA: peptidoglycan-binding domain-containing protein [Verrucomicrobiae bacterium]|nr:peptidoglycan-binding domain-containing protein [Verrucomicrobiae bacterium]